MLVGVRIVANAARKHGWITIKDVRDQFEAAQLPKNIYGNVFKTAVKEGVLEPGGYMRIPRENSSSTDRVKVYSSLVYSP